MDAETKRLRIESTAKWFNEMHPRYIATVVALDSENPEICIVHKDGGTVQLMRHKLQELDELFAPIDRDYMVVSENLNGIPTLCFNFSI